jgi:small neutral amino acid transporter SnatA (MarC family)
MSKIICSKGMGLVEVMIALFLATVSVMAIFSLQAPAFRTTAQSDYFGRAVEILQRQLENTEVYLMNVCNTAANTDTGIPAIPTAVGGSATSTYCVLTSGSSAPPPCETIIAIIDGDAIYKVSTTITYMPPVPPSVTSSYFRVVVRVTWSRNTTGISQTIFVSRQEYFKVSC